ncbi:hypothetical protein BH11PSE11_BH11PSE11_11430 [soil metagenome]
MTKATPGSGNRQSRGLARFQFLVWLVLVGILAAVFLERVIWYQQYAEKAAVDIVVMNLRSGLRLRMAELMASDRWNEVGDLTRQNPVNWIEAGSIADVIKQKPIDRSAKKLPNYLGELDNPNPKYIPAGNWYFNVATLELIYVPEHAKFFDFGTSGDRTLVFKITSLQPAKQKSDGSWTRAEGITLVQKQAAGGWN